MNNELSGRQTWTILIRHPAMFLEGKKEPTDTSFRLVSKPRFEPRSLEYKAGILTNLHRSVSRSTQAEEGNVKLSLCLTKHHAMKTYWGVEV
jgi:hypothetical protein